MMPLQMPTRHGSTNSRAIALPTPQRAGGPSLAAVLSARRSIRDFAASALTLADLGQLLWAAQGVTEDSGGRTAPSAGATYPLELYVATGEVQGLAPGIYRYLPRGHALRRVATGNIHRKLAAAALSQWWIAHAAAIVVIAAVYPRTTGKYGGRGQRYAQIEAGHAGANLCLQATALGLGCTVVGAYDDAAVKAVIGTEAPGEPLCLLPVGRA